MSGANWLQLLALVAGVLVIARALGPYLARVLTNGPAPGDRVFLPVERVIYKATGVDPAREQPWSLYALSLLAFSAVSALGLFALQRLQGVLPLNPTDVDSVPPALAFNTAVSFTTNTNWQNYAGESTMSHLTQMAGLTVQNFISAAVGIAVAVALVRGLTRRRSETIGNFWVDLTRVTIRVLVPLALVLALMLASQGVVQSLRGSAEARTVEGADPGDLPRSRREPGGDQGARYERRWHRQRQLRTPVREPDGVHEPARDPGPARDPVRARVRVRGPRRQPPAGLGDSRGDVRPLDRLGRSRHGPRARRQPAHRARRRRTWKAKRCGSAPPPPACSRPPRLAPRPARSTPRTTASRRSVGPSRW